MADVNGAAEAEIRSRSRLLHSPKMLAIMLVALAAIAGGAAYWFLMPRHSPPPIEQQAAEPPVYLEVKPFVVSVADNAGTPHFVQLGVDMALSNKGAGNIVGAILPEIQDAMRQTVLGFKVEDIVTPAGVDRLRQAMIASANHVLLQRLGPAEVARRSGSVKNGAIVRNLYFSTLIVE